MSIARQLVTASLEYAKALDLLDAEHPQAHAARERIWAQAEAHLAKLIQRYIDVVIMGYGKDLEELLKDVPPVTKELYEEVKQMTAHVEAIVTNAKEEL